MSVEFQNDLKEIPLGEQGPPQTGFHTLVCGLVDQGLKSLHLSRKCLFSLFTAGESVKDEERYQENSF